VTNGLDREGMNGSLSELENLLHRHLPALTKETTKYLKSVGQCLCRCLHQESSEHGT
jgi:hypothetical protein